MVERLLSFAEPAGAAYGAIAGDSEGTATALVLQRSAEPVAIEGGELRAGQGTLSVLGGELSLVTGLAAQSSPLGFEAPGGFTAAVQAVTASVELKNGEGGFEAVGVAWSFGPAEREPESVLRTLWSRQRDGSLLAVFAVRPAGGSDHAEEEVGAALIGRDGEVRSFAEPLLSTEYDSAGAHTRATLELWGDEEGAPADRAGGTRQLGGAAGLGALRIEAARFEWSVRGAAGLGAYEIVSA